jgi:hypothetical protein
MTDFRNLLSAAPNNVNESEGDLTFGGQYGYEKNLSYSITGLPVIIIKRSMV